MTRIGYPQRQMSSLDVQFPTYIIPQVCHLCNDETDKGQPDSERIGWICNECNRERHFAREALNSEQE